MTFLGDTQTRPDVTVSALAACLDLPESAVSNLVSIGPANNAGGYELSFTLSQAASAPGSGGVPTQLNAGRHTFATAGYSFAAAPQITGLSPAVGAISGGTAVTITGSGFTGATAVRFGGTAAASYTVVSDTQITATAPAGAAGTVNVTVTTASGTTADAGTADDFRYAVVPPTISATFSPTSMVNGGTSTLTVTLSNPNAGTTLTGVSVAAAALPANLVGDDSPMFPACGGVPAYDPDTRALQLSGGSLAPNASCAFSLAVTSTVTGSYAYTTGVVSSTQSGAGSTATTPIPLTVAPPIPAPVVTAVSPNAGPTGGGTAVTITGSNLTGATAVRFGGTAAASYTVVSDTQIAATAPAGSAGTVNVTVTTGGGTSADAGTADDFDYGVAPSISGSIAETVPFSQTSPVTVDIPARATVSGSPTAWYLGTSGTDTSLAVPGGSVTISAAGVVTFTKAAGFSGVQDVQVRAANPFGESSPSVISFTVVAPPTISAAFSPTSIASGGSATLTLTLSNPNAGTTLTGVDVAGAALPANLAGDTLSRTCDGVAGYSFATRILSIFSVSLAPNASCTVSLSVTSAATGTYSYTTGVVSSTQSGSGETATTATALTVTAPVPAPVVTSLSPNAGPISGGTVVTIGGSNFTGATMVSFGPNTVPAGQFVSGSDTQIVVAAPPGSNATVNVTVTTAGGTSADAGTADDFTYVAAPTLTSFSFGSAVAYNTGSGGATTIDVAAGSGATNAPTSWAVVLGTTAGGGTVSIDAAGVASYTPAAGFRGTDTFQVNATNAGGTSADTTVSVLVGDPVLTISLTGSGAQQGAALSGHAIQVAGGRAPYACATTPATGSLPAGVSIAADCSLTGAPTQSGSFAFTVDVTDSSLGPGGPAPSTQRSGTLSLAIGRGEQTIAFTRPSDIVAFTANQQVTLTATATSGLPVAFASATPAVCTVSGSTATVIAAGTCTIAADQAGDTNWNAAPQVQQSFFIWPGEQTIAFTRPSDIVAFTPNQQVTLTATATSGLPVAFASATPAVCTVSGSTATVIAAGTCTIAADQAGDANWTAAPQVQQSFAIGRGGQTIAFTAPDDIVAFTPNQQVTLTATATSGLPVAFASTTPAVCTVSGSTATVLAAGTCTIAADQAGDANWDAAPQVQQSFAIGRGEQTIAFTRPSDIVAFTPNQQVTLAATATSGLPVAFTSTTPAVCSVSGATATVLAAGTCTITADQAGDATWNAAPEVQQSFAIGRGGNVITFPRPADTGVARTPPTLAASASSGLAVSYASDTPAVCTVTPQGALALVAVGACTIRASQAGDANFEPATPVTVTFAVLDDLRPTVVLSGAPTSVSGTTAFSVTATFGEAVTGFGTAGVRVVNGVASLVTPVSASVYTITVTPAGAGAIEVSIPTDAAFDAGNNGNLPSAAVAIATTTVADTQAVIHSFMSNRARGLIGSGPDLIGFLDSGPGAGPGGVGASAGNAFAVQARRGFYDVGFFTSLSALNRFAGEPILGLGAMPGEAGDTSDTGDWRAGFNPARFDVWMDLKGRHASTDTSRQTLWIGTVGAHYFLTPNLLVGALAQFDSADETRTSGADVSGKGWMTGPYAAGRLPGTAMQWEARVAWGGSDNRISPFGTYADTFTTDRVLASGKVAGTFRFGDLLFTPATSLSYFREDQHAYVDSLGNTIPGSLIELGELKFGPTLSQSFALAGGAWLTPKTEVSGVWAFADKAGGAPNAGEGSLRGRIDLGIDYTNPFGWSFFLEGYYDGIGSKDYEAVGGKARIGKRF